MIRTVAVPACDPQSLGAAVFVLLDPDCFAPFARDHETCSAPLLILTPDRHAGLASNLAQQLARNEACADLRCGSLVQPIGNARETIVLRRSLRENDQLGISELRHLLLLVLREQHPLSPARPRKGTTAGGVQEGGAAAPRQWTQQCSTCQ